EAEMSVPLAQQRLPLPALRMQDVSLQTLQLRIFRRGDLHLQLEPAAGWMAEEASAIGEYRRGTGRLIADLRRVSATARLPVVLRSVNQPQVGGNLFIRADESDGDWRGQIDLRLDVARGE